MSFNYDEINLSTISSIDYLEKVLEESVDYSNEYNSLTGYNHFIESLGNRNLINPKTHSLLENELISRIKSKKPFSLIRLGDGEGDLLFWLKHKDNYPHLAALSTLKILTIMFGKKAPTPHQWDNFVHYLDLAINESDIIGIPNYQQTSLALEKLKSNDSLSFDFRGNTGIVAVRDYLSTKNDQFYQDKIICNWHVHHSLLAFMSTIIVYADKVSAISCYPNILEVLQENFNITKGQLISIPPQASNIKNSPDEFHYPERFTDINDYLKKTDSVEEGELFLVAAGLLGKYYCGLIKQQGGMAIDIGSIMDVWMGYGVRGYQSEEFVQKYKLI